VRQGEEMNFVDLVPPLLQVVRSGASFLATYAIAALINFSALNDELKHALSAQGAAQVCVEQLQSKEEDLSYYSLVLLVNITKTASQRKLAKEAGLIKALVEILEVYSNHVEQKTKLLVQVVSLIGQMANDENCRRELIQRSTPGGSRQADVPYHLLAMLTRAPTGLTGAAFKAKLCFAFRQLCRGDYKMKAEVGKHAIPRIQEDFSTHMTTLTPEQVVQSLLLLQSLAEFRNNAVQMDDALREPLEKLLNHLKNQGGAFSSNREGIKDLVVALRAQIDRQTKEEFFL